jgi:hypothetical protein
MSLIKFLAQYKIMKLRILSFSLYILVAQSCSSLSNIKQEPTGNRFIASEFTSNSCHELMERLIEKGYNEKIRQALEAKQLVHRSHSSLTIQRPRPSILASLYKRTERFFARVINDNRYPAYYIFDEEETTSKIIAYIRGYTRPDFRRSVGEGNAINDFGPEVRRWLDDYENYSTQIDDLVKTRVSIAYNLNLLKHYKSSAPDIDRVTLSFYKNGKLEETIFTFRREDDNLTVLIRDLERELKRFDGGFFAKESRDHVRVNFDFFNEGAIRDRVLQQSRLRDKILILNRESEFAYMNISNRADMDQPHEEGLIALRELYNRTTNLLMDQEIVPSGWATTRISRDTMLAELRQSISSNRRLQRLRDNSQVMRNYLDEADISQARLTTRGLGFYTRAAYFLTPGAFTVSGLIAVFNLDEPLSQLYNSFLTWRHGKKMECVRERNEEAFLSCLYRHYEKEYPDIIRMALKNPEFNPWDFEGIARLEGLDEKIVSLYIADVQEMIKYRQYFVYIQNRRVEIQQLFNDSHQDLINAVQFDPEDRPTCISVGNNELGLCIYETILSGMLNISGHKDDHFIEEDFIYSDYDNVPEEIREEYIEAVSRVLMMRSIYEDLNGLEDYQIRIFTD